MAWRGRQRAEIVGLLDEASALKERADLYYRTAYLDSQISLLEQAAANCKKVLARNDLSNKKRLGGHHERARALSRDIDNLLKRTRTGYQFVKDKLESAIVRYRSGDFQSANDLLADICNRDNMVSGAFQFRRNIKDIKDAIIAFGNKNRVEASGLFARSISSNKEFRVRYGFTDFTPQWMEEAGSFASGGVAICGWLSDCDAAIAKGEGFRPLLDDGRLNELEGLVATDRFAFAAETVFEYKKKMESGIQNYLLGLVEEGKISEALNAVRYREDLSVGDIRAVRGRIKGLFEEAIKDFEGLAEKGDLDGAKASLSRLDIYRSLGATNNASARIDAAGSILSVWDKLNSSGVLAYFNNPVIFVRAMVSYQEEDIKNASDLLHLVESNSENARGMVKRMERNIDRMEGFREVLDSDDGWAGAESHAKRIEALDFIVSSLGADYLYMRAQIELHRWLGSYYYHEEDLDRSREEYEESLRLIESDTYMMNAYKDEADKIKKDLDDLDSGYGEEDDESPDEDDDYESPDEEDAAEVQPMTRSRSEISPEDAKLALNKMEIEGLYTCEYHAGEDGSLNFTPKSDTFEGRALARLLNEAAKRLAINILALPGPMKAELMEIAGALSAHRSTAPPTIGVARNCPFTSVRRSSDGLVLFDAEIVELFIKIMNDPNYSNYKIHYDHVIDWLVSERLFHEIFHTSREKEQTIRDIHYYYLLLNAAGMRKDVKEFFDSPLVKGSTIAQKTKVRFKFIERQARRLMRNKSIDVKKVSVSWDRTGIP